MASWEPVTLPEDGAKAWRVTLKIGDDVSDPQRLMGKPVSISIKGGPVSITACLAPESEYHPILLRQLTGLYHLPERLFALKATGVGIVTVFVVGR